MQGPYFEYIQSYSSQFLFRFDADKSVQQAIYQLTLEYSISFLKHSKEHCFRRKFPVVGSPDMAQMEKIETNLIAEKFLLEKNLVKCKNAVVIHLKGK